MEKQLTPRTNSELADLLTAVHQLDKEDRRNIMSISFPLFFAYYYHDYIRSPFSEDHFVVFKDLEDLTNGVIDTYILITYRGFAKTSIMRGYNTWLIVTGKKKYINIDSYDGANAKNTIAQQQHYLANNKPLLNDFNAGNSFIEQKTIKADTKATSSEFITNSGSKMEAFSVGQSVRGRVMSDGTRPQVFNFDDVENEITIKSEITIEKIIEHIDSAITASDAGDIPMTIILGNYISSTGVVEHLISLAEDKKTMRVRNIPLYNDKGEIRWNRYSKEFVESIKEKIGELKFQEEYLNQPRDLTSAEIKKDLIKYEKRSYLDTINKITYMAIDTALSDKETDDDTGIAIGHFDTLGNVYIEPKALHQNTYELIEEIFRMYVAYKPQIIVIEKTLQSGVLKHILEEESMRRMMTLPIQWIAHSSDKKIRIRAALQPKYKAGKIYHITNEDGSKPGGSQGLEKYERQLTRFPNGIHDDVIDAVATLFEVAHLSVGEYKNTRKIEDRPRGISFS